MKKDILCVFNRKKVIGLYISNETVDLVVLQGSIKGPKLVNFSQTYIYPKEKKTGVIIPEAEDSVVDKTDSTLISEKNTRDDYVVEAVQRVFKENKIKPKNVACAIASEEAMVRYFQMPKIPTKEWRSAINFEAKRYIPFRMEDVASDFQVIHGKAASMTMDVVFVAVRQNTIERFITLLEKAGIRPIIIEPAPFSLIRAFNAAGQIDNKINTAIINIETKLTNISILRNGVPYIIRDIPLDEGVSGEGSLEPIFERLLSEIKLSFDFYEKQFPSETIDKIIIYSQLPLENWHELVGKELQIAIEVGDPLRGIRIKKGIVPPRVAIAFGLALRGLSETFIDVNLCKERLFVYRKKEMFLKMVFLEASAAVFLLIIAKLLCLKAIAPLSNELSRTLSERPKEEVNIKDENIDALERLKNEMEAKKYVMDNIITKRTYFTGRWEGLVKVMPKNIWLTEVSFEEKIDKKDISKVFREFDIKGYCIIDGKISESDTVNSFLIGLKENAAINKGMYKADIVSVEKTELNGEKVSRFEILFTGP